MAAFHQHLGFSAFVGSAYSATLWCAGVVEPAVAIFAGATCTFAGMLPDLDSDTSKPVRELFNVLGMVGALLALHRLRHQASFPAETCLLIAVATYLLLRYGAAAILRWCTVHRGMFHSLPAALIVGSLMFLVYDPAYLAARWAVAAGMSLGYLSHLVLDALWQLRSPGGLVALADGGPIKLVGQSRWANVVCWSLLLLLSYCVAVEMNWLTPLEPYSQRWLSALNHTARDSFFSR
ncbi:MAG: metal-dependent hydrolase [Gemmatales bacterium]|nr:metal-dependent hydrolase [Gemmatales bacterium]MDW7995282.1 metal-dependent hydrolase [Gemmatales bacterium]